MIPTTVEEAKAQKGSVVYIAGKAGLSCLSRFGGPGLPIQYHVVKKANGVPPLEEIQETAEIVSLVPIPEEILAKALAVFRAAYKRLSSEMIVILKWVTKTDRAGKTYGEYALDRPDYAMVSGGHLRYNYQGPNMGTIHSHGSMGAFFSGVDDANEPAEIPGIYAVMGRINDSTIDIKASVTGSGSRFGIGLTNFKMSSYRDLSPEEADWWLENVMLSSVAESKKDGFYILGVDRKIEFWTEDEARANELAPEMASVVPVREYTPPTSVVQVAHAADIFTKSAHTLSPDDWDWLGSLYSTWDRDYLRQAASDVPAQPSPIIQIAPGTKEAAPVQNIRRLTKRERRNRRTALAESIADSGELLKMVRCLLTLADPDELEEINRCVHKKMLGWS